MFRKFLCAFLFALMTSFVIAQQTTVTPGIGLQIPGYGSSNWQVPISYNMNRIDKFLSGQLAIPSLTVTNLNAQNFTPSAANIVGSLGFNPLNPANNLSDITNSAAALNNLGAMSVSAYQGAWLSASTYFKGQIVTFGAASYFSLVTPNTGNEPDTNPTKWGPLSTAGVSPAGLPLQEQLNSGSGTLAGGILRGGPGNLDMLNPGAIVAARTNYVIPSTQSNWYPAQWPWNFVQNVTKRYSFGDDVSPVNVNLNLFSGASEYLDQLDSQNLGNFMNAGAISAHINSQTPYQIGGMFQLGIDQHATDDAVMMTINNHCAGIGRGDNEGCELFRFFMDFLETPFTGSITLLGNDTLGNPKLQLSGGGGYASAGEQRVLVNQSEAWTSPGNMSTTATWSTDNRFELITGDAASAVTTHFATLTGGTGISAYTTLVGGADNQRYNGSCPATVIGTWPFGGSSPDPYAASAPDGTGTHTTAQCVQLASTAGISAGSVIGIFGGGTNWEYTTVQSVPATGYVVVNLKRSHVPGEYVSTGGGVGFCFQDGHDSNAPCYPIMATLAGNQMLLYSNSDSTVGNSEVKSTLYKSNTAPTPKTITPTVVGGVVTSIAQNAVGYSVPGDTASSGRLPTPNLTFTGTGSCTVAPTFSWTVDPNSIYTATLVTGGSGCPSDFGITVQSVYPNPFRLLPNTRVAFVVNPATEAAYLANPEAYNHIDPSASTGYVVVDPFAAPSSQWVAGDSVLQTPHQQQFMGSQININGNLLTSRSQKTGPIMSEVFSGIAGFGNALKVVGNRQSANVYLGREVNHWAPGNPSLPLCSVNPNIPCYDPLDGQFTVPPAQRYAGLLGGILFDFPPVNGNAVIAVGCADGYGGYTTKARCNATTPIYDQYPLLRSYSGTGAYPTTLFVNPANDSWTMDLKGAGTFTVLGNVAATNNVAGVSLTATGPANTGSTPVSLTLGNVGSAGGTFGTFGSGASGDSSATIGMKQVGAPSVIAGATIPPPPGGPYGSGTSGTTTYSYVCTSVTQFGETLPSVTATTNSGAATLNGTNKNGVLCSPGVGGQSVNFYRTSTTGGLSAGLICSHVAGNPAACSDTGQAAGAAVPTKDTSGAISLSGVTLTAVQGAGTKVASASGTFTNGDLRGTNATGDEVNVPISGFCQTSGGGCPTPANIPLRYVGTVPLTAAGPDALSVTGLTSANFCSTQYLGTSTASAVLKTTTSAGSVSLSHATATAGDTVAVFCNLL